MHQKHHLRNINAEKNALFSSFLKEFEFHESFKKIRFFCNRFFNQNEKVQWLVQSKRKWRKQALNKG